MTAGEPASSATKRTAPIELNPTLVLAAQRARVRQALAADAQSRADLLEEVANLEAYVRQLQEEVTDLRRQLAPAAPPSSGPWGPEDSTDPERT